MKTISNTRTQVRGTCSICGNDHAVKGQHMVNHGYTVNYGNFNGACSGSNKVHYGHEAAPQTIMLVVDRLKARLKALSTLVIGAKSKVDAFPPRTDNEASSVTSNRYDLEKSLSAIVLELETHLPNAIKSLTERANNWVEHDVFEVDVEALELEERKQRKIISDEKKKQKEIENEEKRLRIEKREDSACDKEEFLLSMQWRQVIIDGVVVKEWQAEYDDKGDLFHALKEQLRLLLIDKCLKGEISVDDIYFTNFNSSLVSRTQPAKKGRQLAKFNSKTKYAVLFRFNDIYNTEVLSDIIKLEIDKDSFYVTEIVNDCTTIDEYKHSNTLYDLINHVVPKNRKYIESTVIVKNYDGEEVSRQVALGCWQNTAIGNEVTTHRPIGRCFLFR